MGVTVSCDEDVGEVGEDAVLYSIFSAIFDEMWLLTTGPMVKKNRDLHRVFRVKELPVYLREALLSRINPIL